MGVALASALMLLLARGKDFGQLRLALFRQAPEN